MLAVNVREFKKVLERAGSNPIFELQVSDSTQTMNAILKDRQMRPVDGTLVHLDFMQVLMDQPIEVTVALDFEGAPIGVEKGGTFSVVSRDMRVSCLPDRIPDKITVDVSGLDIGRSIHVAQITLPEGVTASDLDLTLASVVAPREE
jgi:large subunit ribosomal protein L25